VTEAPGWEGAQGSRVYRAGRSLVGVRSQAHLLRESHSVSSSKTRRWSGAAALITKEKITPKNGSLGGLLQRKESGKRGNEHTLIRGGAKLRTEVRANFKGV